MVARLECGAMLKPGLDGLLGLLDLLFELLEPAAPRQKHGQFQLCDWFYCWEWDNGQRVWYGLLSCHGAYPPW